MKCLKRIKGELPEEIIKAGEPYIKAREAYDKAREAYDKAREAYIKAVNRNKKDLLAMHAKECPECKFDWDEGIIFEEERW